MAEKANFTEYVLSSYEEQINNLFGNERNLSFSFLAGVCLVADKVEATKVGVVNKANSGEYKISFFQDFSFNAEYPTHLTDCNIVTLGEYTFLEIITPFLASKTMDFIIAKTEDMEGIITEYQKRRKNETRQLVKLIGVPVEEVRHYTIDFLLNEDFRNYCTEKNIRLKRGVVFEGHPGNGKTALIQWLNQEAVANNIEFKVFSNFKQFIDSAEDFYGKEKKIFVFEDFDAHAGERDDNGNSSGDPLAMILQVLDGVRQIDNVVSIFTTNYVDHFDKAFLRPGRIDKSFKFELPTAEHRLEFFQHYLSDKAKFHDFLVKATGGKVDNVSYAILKGICDEIYIKEFHTGQEITEEEAGNIVKEVIKSASKGKDSKKVEDFIL